MRYDPRYHAPARRKRRSGATAPVAGLEHARRDAEAAKLSTDELQGLLSDYRSGDESARGKLQAGLSYLIYECAQTVTFDEISDHAIAIATCLDRLRDNDVDAAGLESYVRAELWSERIADHTEHNVKLPRRGREGLDQPERRNRQHALADVSWTAIDIDNELLDNDAREVVRLLRERRTLTEVRELTGLSRRAIDRILEAIARAAA